MDTSFYHKSWPLAESPEYRLLYSTRTGAYALLAAEDHAAFQGGAVDPETDAALLDLGLLVPDQEQEKVEVRNLVAEVNRHTSGPVVSIILGMACNFRCRYCYEGVQKGDYDMTDATALQLIAFLKQLSGPAAKKMTLDFYGGEPLLYVRRIKEIAGTMQDFMRARGGEFRCTLVTNGSLLTRQTVAELKAYGLTSVKVTVDGPAESHDYFRPFKHGQPSFETIIDNILASHDLVKITIGGNFTRDSCRKFPALLDHFDMIGLTPAMLGQVKFDPVMQTSDRFSHSEFRSGCVSINETWVAEGSLLLRREVLQRGYKTPEITPTLCMVDLDNSFTIHYNGDIYKCPSMIGHTDYVVGHVSTAIQPYREIYQVDNWRHQEECRNCVYLPLCFGGCRYMEFQRSGSLTAVDCRREYLDTALEEMVQQDVKYRWGKKATETED